MMGYKCRKCRIFLCQSISEGELPECCHTWGDIRCIEPMEADGCYVDWMQADIFKGDWVRGKLHCPQCRSKLGAFDFVKGSRCSCKKELLPEVYLLLCKVDVINPPKQGHESETAQSKRAVVISCKDKEDTRYSNAATPRGSGHERCRSWSGSVGMVGVHPMRSRSKHSLHTLEHHKPMLLSKSSIDMLQKEVIREEIAVDLKSEHMCRVCLDIVVMPRSCKPCNHVFCEYCLRMLTLHSKSSQYVHCPLCRHLIHWTFPQPELCLEVMLCYPEKYESRYNEQRLMVSVPLPRASTVSRARPISNQAINLLFLSILCFLFFFLCFIPGIYLSSFVYGYIVDWIHDDYDSIVISHIIHDIHLAPQYIYSSGILLLILPSFVLSVFVYIMCI